MLFDLQLLGKLDAAGNTDVIENRTLAAASVEEAVSGIKQTGSRVELGTPSIRRTSGLVRVVRHPFFIQSLLSIGACHNPDRRTQMRIGRLPVRHEIAYLRLAPSELSGLNQNSRPQSPEPQLRLMPCRLLFFQILFRFRDRRFTSWVRRTREPCEHPSEISRIAGQSLTVSPRP
jgi:hypothetical protein